MSTCYGLGPVLFGPYNRYALYRTSDKTWLVRDAEPENEVSPTILLAHGPKPQTISESPDLDTAIKGLDGAPKHSN